MELKINEVQLPEQITFNYEELKQELAEKLSTYETLVYSDEQIKEAKADKANLNKLKKALNDERIRREKEYMQPLNDFKAKINEIIGIIDKPIALIDKQVKEYEDKQKQDKMDKIKALWSEMDVPEGLTLERVFDDRMLNVSYGMNHVKQKMLDDIKRFNRDMETLAGLPEFGFEAQQEYIRTFDLNKALAEGQRMAQVQKKKEEAARAAAEAEQARLKAEEETKQSAFPDDAMNPPVTEEEIAQSRQEYIDAASANGVHPVIAPAKQWISFKALLTVEDATALKQFFESRNIQFEAV